MSKKKGLSLRAEGVVALTALSTLIGVGTIIFHNIEKWTWIQSFYFTIVTLTTVGYGDLHPTTDKSRLVAAIFILIGVGIAVTAIGILGSNYLKLREELLRRNRQDHKD